MNCEWMSQLLQNGRLKNGFVPLKPDSELRELTRLRKYLEDEKTRLVNRINNIFDAANIRLNCETCDILGVSGQVMLSQLMGELDPTKLVKMSKGALKRKQAELKDTLRTKLKDHHRFMMRLLIDRFGRLEKELEMLDERIEAVMKHADMKAECMKGKEGNIGTLTFSEALSLLMEIWGISRRHAENILAEIGTDLSQLMTECIAHPSSPVYGPSGVTSDSQNELLNKMIAEARGMSVSF